MPALPRVLSHNLRLKLLALGLSVLLWALVQSEPRNAETFSAVPVQVELVDTAWSLAAPPEPEAVQLRLAGSTREIIRLAREGTAVRVPIRAVGSADTVVALRREWVELGDGSGLGVESLSPARVRLSFEPSLSRVLPLSLRIRGSLPERLALASPLSLTPQVVRVRGPRSRVEGLDSVGLEPVDLSAVRSSTTLQVPVDTAGLGDARVLPATATVAVRVEDRIERVFPAVPVELPGDGGAGLRVTPPQVAVTLRGARTLVTAVDPAALRIAVAEELLAGMVAGEERRVPLRAVGLPALVTARLEPELVAVTRAGDDAGPAGGGGR